MQLLEKLPSYTDWNKNNLHGQEGNLQAYIEYSIKVNSAVISAAVFWPDITEIDGYILRSNAIPPDWQLFLKKAKAASWSKADIEYIINKLNILDLFINDASRDDIGDSIYISLAEIIEEMWRCKLSKGFPNINFQLGINNKQIDPEIYFFQIS